MQQNTERARILAIDDDEKQLASIRRILHGFFNIITTKDPAHALKIFEYEGPFAAVISDYRMPFMNGIELFSQILIMDRNVQRILLTGHAELQMAIDAVNQGKITAFLTKPTPAVSIRSVITEAVSIYNETRSREGCSASLNINDKISLPKQYSADLYAPLTVKEKEVLVLLAKGFSNEEISLTLNIAVGTVKSHLVNLCGKLEVNTRSKAVARALELGLVQF